MRAEKVEDRGPSERVAILRSSKPLEYAAGQVLEKIGLTANGPYWYEREGKACETDHLATAFDSVDYFAFRHHFFVECEYREPSKKWIFYPATANVVDTSEISILDGFVRTKSRRPFSLLGLRHDNPLDLPRVGPGSEIFKEDKGGWKNNPQGIENAMRQAILPVSNHIAVTLREALLLSDPAIIGLYHSVIVTTAGLYVLKDGVDWRNLEALADPTKSFRLVPAVAPCFNTPEYAVSFLRERVSSLLLELKEDIETTDGFYMISGRPSGPPGKMTADEIHRHAQRANPCRVLIVNFDTLETTLSAYLAFLRKRILEQHQKYRAVGPL